MAASQLRAHMKFTLRHKYRSWKQRNRLGHLGRSVFIEDGVHLMRYPKLISVDDEVVLKRGAHICACNESATVHVGARTTVGYHTFIFASSGIAVGSDCLIAPFVYLVDSDHEIALGTPINQQPNSSAPIKIGNGVWLATGVKVLKGVNIGDGAVVAANSVVNRDIPPNEIWAGTPAKKVGERT